MKITLRLIVSLIVVVASVATFAAYLQVRQEESRQQEELERRSRLLAESLQETIEPLLSQGPSQRLQRLVEKFGNRERLAGVAVYDIKGTPLAITASLASALPTPPKVITRSLNESIDLGDLESINGKPMHFYALPLRTEEKMAGVLMIVHDATYIRTQLSRIWRHAFGRVLIQMILISLVTLLIVRWSIVGPIAKISEWMKQLRAGEMAEPFALPKGDLFAPLAKEVTTRV